MLKDNMQINQKGFASILIILLVLLVGAVGYFVYVKKSEPVAQQHTQISTNPDATANWKTYRNDTYGFKVKYPDY